MVPHAPRPWSQNVCCPVRCLVPPFPLFLDIRFAHSLLLAASRVAIGPRAAPSVPCPKAAARTPGPRVASSASSRTLFGPSFPSHSLALPRPPLHSFVGLRFSLALPARPFRSPSSLALPTRRGFLLLIPTGKQAIKGQFITLVKQGGIPATFLLSILVLKKRYHTIHYVGCVGVLLGIALVVAPSLADAPVDNWWYIIPLVLSTIPMAGSSVTQEIVLQVRVTLALERGAALYMYDVQVQRSMHTGTLQYDILLRTET